MNSTQLIHCLIVVYGCIVYVDAFDIRQHLATKTPYNSRPSVHNYHYHSQQHPDTSEQCTPQHLFMVIRHGTRYPSKKYVRKFKKLEQLFGAMNNAPDWVKQWKCPFDEYDDAQLCSVGENELYDMGKRIRSLYPSLFEKPYHPIRYDFRSTQLHRSLQSGSAFGVGLFENSGNLGKSKVQPIAIVSETAKHDHHLRFHKACPAYTRSIKKNDTLRDTGESAKLEEFFLPNITQHLEKQLGVEGNSLGHKDVSTIWNMCKMEAAVLDDTTKTCSLFLEEHVLQMEVIDDVDDYWYKAHGFNINYEMACPLARAILESIETYEETNTKARFWFAHAETVIPLLAFFQLFKEESPIMYSSDFQINHNRRWRSSALAPFAANFAVVVHTCGENQTKKIQVMHNEQTIRFTYDVCNGKWLCPLEELLESMSHIQECDLEDLCE